MNLANLLLMDREAEQALAVLAGTAPAGGQGLSWRSQRAAALLMAGRRAEARAELEAAAGAPGDAAITLGWLRIALDNGLSERGEPGRSARLHHRNAAIRHQLDRTNPGGAPHGPCRRRALRRA